MANQHEKESLYYELADIFVNYARDNKRKAYMTYCERHNVEHPTKKAYDEAARRYFNRPEVQRYVAEIRAENREKFKYMREQNIERLVAIADGEKTSDNNRIQAIKEINQIMGYNQTNINLDAKQEIVVEIEGID